jgi:hypothetical protein
MLIIPFLLIGNIVANTLQNGMIKKADTGDKEADLLC